MSTESNSRPLCTNCSHAKCKDKTFRKTNKLKNCCYNIFCCGYCLKKTTSNCRCKKERPKRPERYTRRRKLVTYVKNNPQSSIHQGKAIGKSNENEQELHFCTVLSKLSPKHSNYPSYSPHMSTLFVSRSF